MILTFTGAFPPTGAGVKDTRQSFNRLMLEGIHSAVDATLSDARSQDPYQSIGPRYYSEDMVTGNGVGVSYGNRSPIFPFREEDTRPHWPPFGPGSSLATWAIAKGIPPYLVARKISRVGTTGNHIFRTAREQHRSQLDSAIQNALYAWLVESLTPERV